MNENERIEVQQVSDAPLYLRIFHSFIDTTILDGSEKIVFITLKRFLNVQVDTGSVYPSLRTLSRCTGMGEKKVRQCLRSLQRKGLIKIERRGLTKTNLYTIYDYDAIWKSNDQNKIQEIINETPEDSAVRLLKEKGYTILPPKEKGLESPTDQSDNPSPNSSTARNNSFFNNKITNGKSQATERYTMDQIQQLYDYRDICISYPTLKRDIDAVMSILYDTLNSTREYIRIKGEDKPTMVVISKLMRLTDEGIIYAIKKFSEQTDRIHNANSYMLSILYHAEEQMQLDIKNQVSHDKYY